MNNVLTTSNGNAVATKSNATKSNAILSLSDTTVMIQKLVVGTKCKVFTDSKYYVGFGVKCNGFSVNTKKTKYNVYCNESVVSVIESLKLTGVSITRDGNATDKTRPHYIECTDTKSLKTMITTVIDSLYKVATDTN